MEFKVCRTCGEELEVTKENFYFRLDAKGKYRFSSPDCRECINEKDREERLREKELDVCGSDRVKIKPGTWSDDKQKAQTFQFLTLMGWKYNPEKNLWYDNIKKTADGKFIGVWQKDTSRKRKYKRNSIPEDQIPNIRIVHKHLKDKYTKHFIREIQIDYYTNNHQLKTMLDNRPGCERIIKYVLIKTSALLKKKKGCKLTTD
jgi:hypothetical protein